MPPLETASIQRFMSTVNRAAQTRSRDLRLDMTEATQLAAEIGALLGRLAAQQQPTPPTLTPGAMDGGNFS